MKIDWIRTVIAVCFCALITWGLFELCRCEENRVLLTCVSAFLLTVTGVMSLGIAFESERVTTMFRLVSQIAFWLLLIMNVIFALVTFSMPLYLILNGMVALIYALSAQKIGRSDV